MSSAASRDPKVCALVERAVCFFFMCGKHRLVGATPTAHRTRRRGSMGHKRTTQTRQHAIAQKTKRKFIAKQKPKTAQRQVKMAPIDIAVPARGKIKAHDTLASVAASDNGWGLKNRRGEFAGAGVPQSLLVWSAARSVCARRTRQCRAVTERQSAIFTAAVVATAHEQWQAAFARS